MRLGGLRVVRDRAGARIQRWRGVQDEAATDGDERGEEDREVAMVRGDENAEPLKKMLDHRRCHSQQEAGGGADSLGATSPPPAQLRRAAVTSVAVTRLTAPPPPCGGGRQQATGPVRPSPWTRPPTCAEQRRSRSATSTARACPRTGASCWKTGCGEKRSCRAS